jgi:hypothetical protein
MHPVAAALAVSFFIGLCSSLYGTSLSTLIQIRTEPARLGRVMSVVNVSSYGTVPVSNALTGTIAALGSAPGAYLVGAAIEGAAAVAGLISRPVRTAVFPAGASPGDARDADAGSGPGPDRETGAIAQDDVCTFDVSTAIPASSHSIADYAMFTPLLST